MRTLIRCSLILLLGGLVRTANAQVTAEIVLDQKHFLVGEKIPVTVKVVNRSGRQLQLGKHPDWLTFAIEGEKGSSVVKTGEVPVQGEFTLESGQFGALKVDLQPYFRLSELGHYRVSATVQIRAWDLLVPARSKPFDVIRGARLWSQSFGMIPNEGETNQPPEIRRYILEQANHLRTRLVLYLRITDEDDRRPIKTIAIGPMLSFSHPVGQIDRTNNLHLLYQNGHRTYLYTVVDPDGNTLIRQTHEITSSRPRLQSDEAGGYRVVGGARTISPDDLPAPFRPESTPTMPQGSAP